MKYIITLVLIILFFSIPILSQEKNNVIQSPYESFNKKLNDFYHLNEGDGNNFDEEELYTSYSGDNRLLQKLENLDNKFNSSGVPNDKNTRTTRSETLLGEGFLQVEYISQSWDGTTWVNNYKGSNLYDARNNRVQSIYQNWNTTSMLWENSSKYNYVFDANNNRTEYIYQNWSGGAWVNYSKYLYTYDANNNRTVLLGQSWSGSVWTNDYRYLYTYNANNKVTLRRYQNWNGAAWVDNSRITYTYDANNNLIEQIYETWDGMLWVNDSRYTNIYDANNNQIQQTYQTWSGTAWVNSNRVSISYDANDNQIEYLYESWDVSVWKNTDKYSYIYNANNDIIEVVTQIWDVSVWKNSYKYLYSYNVNNDPIEYLYQNWNVSVWENSSKSTLIYDTNNNNTEQLSQTWNGTIWVNDYKYLYTWAAETSIEVTAPNGGENWPVGTVRNITWTSSNVSNVKLQYSTNNGTNWINITNVSASAGLYAWTIPNTTSTNCLVLISDVSNALLFDESDTIFTISPAVTPTITVSAPNGGEDWEVGSAHSITWTSNNVSNVKIDYSTNNGTNWVTIISSTPAAAQSYSWTIPNVPSTNCKVQISDVTNALINDQSNNVFTISTPVTPVISVSSPNGGENWVVGSVHNITWISSNVANVRIDYTTTGTDLINIITSTPAAAQSYSWTVPNTASTNCKVIISDVANPLTNDLSNSVFTISVNTYPSTITLSTTYSFGDPTLTTSYQIIGLPGANNLPFATIVSGTAGVNGDWRAFWDNGANNNYMIEFDGTSTFNFTPGKAFWVISKNPINVNRPNVNTVTLATDNSYSIPLHNEWNLISNPFDKIVTWASVQSANSGLTQPIHSYQNGSYTNPSNFDIYRGYYFFNSGGLTSLKIPYSSPNPLPKQNSVSLTELKIVLNADAVQKAFISVGVSEDAKPGVDMLDIFSPPSQFCDVNISMYNNELETNYKYLQKDYRPEIGEGQEFDFVVKNISDQTLNMVINGLDNFMDYEIFLLDKKLSKLYDLKKLNLFVVKRNTSEKEYSLLIGTEEFILQKKSDIMPTEFSLFQNYPNPFNPATRIMFSLPQQSNVSLKIYNILGELATELINNQSYDAGYYEVTFDGSQFASGTYLYRLQTSSVGKQPFVEIKKMILIK